MTECDCEVCRAARESRAEAIPAPEGDFAALQAAWETFTAALAATLATTIDDLVTSWLALIDRINARRRR